MMETNQAFQAHVSRPGRTRRMATTMVAAVIHGGEMTLANVGDSRGYLLRDNTATQITTDHSLVAGLVADGVLTPEEAAEHPQRNVILHSLGSTGNDPRIDLFSHRLRPGDTIVLCTDGLTRYVDPVRLHQLVQQQPLSEAAQRLVDHANQSGGSDNVSVVVVRFIGRSTRVLRRGVWWMLLLLGIVLVLVSGLVGAALLRWI
jgi:protein phosphatase